MLDESAHEILKLIISTVLMGDLLLFAIVSSIIVTSKKAPTFKIIVILMFCLLIGDILFIKYAHSKADEVSSQVVNSFNNSKELICPYKDIKVIVSKDKNYILKSSYFIKDEVVIDVDMCKGLVEK